MQKGASAIQRLVRTFAFNDPRPCGQGPAWATASGSAAPTRRARVHGPRVLAYVGCPLLATLTLLASSAPGYDAWSWLIWGREIAGLELSTGEGPAWKRCP